jgi:CRP-like cAMP-binding protein
MASSRYFEKGNSILQTLSTADLALLEQDFVSVELRLRQDLEKPNKKIDYVYFIDSGIVSVVALYPDAVQVEVGVIGCEGMTGLAILHGSDRTPHSTYMQVPGSGRRIPAEKLTSAMRESPTLHRGLLKFAHAFCEQTSHAVGAGSQAKLPVRLARWLLMTHDRVPGNELQLTHEFLSIMLGVRRAGVTEALHALTARKFVALARKRITLLDRKALEKFAGSFYGVPEREYRRVVSEPVLLETLLQNAQTAPLLPDRS